MTNCSNCFCNRVGNRRVDTSSHVVAGWMQSPARSEVFVSARSSSRRQQVCLRNEFRKILSLILFFYLHYIITTFVTTIFSMIKNLERILNRVKSWNRIAVIYNEERLYWKGIGFAFETVSRDTIVVSSLAHNVFETIYTLSIDAEWHSHGLNIDRCILTLATLITPRLMASQFRLIFTVIFSQVPLTSLSSSPSKLRSTYQHPINQILSHRPPTWALLFLARLFFRHPVYNDIEFGQKIRKEDGSNSVQ